MHNKLLIADGHVVIVGGRNIGNHYFGLSERYNFHDIDVLGVGVVARRANTVFDDLWNNDWAVSATELPVMVDDHYIVEQSAMRHSWLMWRVAKETGVVSVTSPT